MVRLKHRYVVVEIDNLESPTKPLKLKPISFYEAVINKVRELHGDYGVALIKTGFLTKYCNEYTKIALMRMKHSSYKIVTSSLPFINSVDGRPIIINTKYVGATMKQCFKFIQNYQKNKLNEMWNSLRNDQERKAFELALLDLSSADKKVKIEGLDADES